MYNWNIISDDNDLELWSKTYLKKTKMQEDNLTFKDIIHWWNDFLRNWRSIIVFTYFQFQGYKKGKKLTKISISLTFSFYLSRKYCSYFIPSITFFYLRQCILVFGIYPKIWSIDRRLEIIAFIVRK